MAIMEISVVPLGLGQTSVGDYIAAVVQYLRQQQLPHYLTDMGTIVEGSTEQLLEVAQVLHEIPFNRGVKRVLTHLTIDDRRDKEVHLDDKIRAVKARLT
ncbi:MAG: MTH1187 family thiamine-binding protein [Desulfobacca sp.]|nr:MTH1187 family thiamine-binding protein [Desulfobacca sp.]